MFEWLWHILYGTPPTRRTPTAATVFDHPRTSRRTPHGEQRVPHADGDDRSADTLPDKWNGDTAHFLQVLDSAWRAPSAEDAVLRWMARRSPSEWTLLDESARSWIRGEHAPPGELHTTLALGWRSFSRDGRLREAAVRSLESDGHEVAPGFLIVRCDDWVQEVRAAAQESVRRLAENGRVPWMQWMPLMLARAGRTRSSEFLSSLVANVTPEAEATLLRHADRSTRRWALARILNRPVEADALEALLQSARDAAVARGLAARLLPVGTDETLARLLMDRRVSVRKVAWEHASRAPAPAMSIPTLARGLLDRSRTIRACAQRVAHAAHIDAAPIYVHSPTGAPAQRRRRLEGLDEWGSPDAVDVASAALADTDLSVRAAAIGVLARRHPNPQRLLLDILPTAEDVALRAVVRALLAARTTVSAELLSSLRQGNSDQRLAAWRLGRSLGKWDRLRAGLLARNDPDERLSALVRADIGAWFAHVYARAGEPPLEIRKFLEEMLATNPEEVPHRDLIRFAVRC